MNQIYSQIVSQGNMMPNLFARSLTLSFVVLLLTGCQTLEIKSRQDSLDKTLHTYETALRWSYIHQAYSLLRPEQIKNSEIPRGLENIKVTQYEILEPATHDEKRGIATQIAIIKYIEKDRQQVKTITDHQLWEYDEKAERWYLISGVPTFVVIPKMRVLPLDK